MSARPKISGKLRTRLVLAATLVFILFGVFLAGEHGFEKRVGSQLEKAAPAARKVIPAPAKRVLRKGLDLLPVYGRTSQWVARKAGSIVYFGIVGLFVLVVRRRKPGTLGQTLAVTVLSGIAMSAIIELFEFPEDLADQVFDLACGALGGFIFGLIAWWWRQRFTQGRAD